MADEELAALAKSSSESFGVLMKRYESRLLAFIRRMSGCRSEDAEDILQESFIKAYYNLNDFDPSLKFSSWIYRIVRNETVSEWRKKKARPSVILDSESWAKIKAANDLAGEMSQKMDREIVERAVNQLPEKYREVVILNYFEGRSYEEMADILRKPTGTIGTLINRAKKQLKDIIIKYGESK